MKVSVVIPAYNAENTVRMAIDSVVKQTYKNIELIVVDDGSQDDTGKIIDAIKETDERIKVIHIQNGGVSKARNAGIEICTGEYIAFVDSDDTMKSRMIEKMVEAMTEEVDLVCCGYTTKTPDGVELFTQEPEDRCWNKRNLYEGIGNLQDKKAFNVIWNKLFRLNIIKKHNIEMDSNVRMGEDFLFVVEYLKYSVGKMRCLSKALYNYFLSPNGAQATLNDGKNFKKRIEQLNEITLLYNCEGYPLDTFYAEQLRCIYTSLIESKELEKILSLIFEDKRCIKMINEYKPTEMKYRYFLKVLKSKNKYMIFLVIKMFAFMKKKSGRIYEWN
ncbi:glycosyltransferase family 2 protein [Robinsoniella peoriensis]|uniref:glycosyltransferase family 2 protein n=1 Tax=Robinsoniella peoriensis TaxID=180332 RepID=UPI0037537B04